MPLSLEYPLSRGTQTASSTHSAQTYSESLQHIDFENCGAGGEIGGMG